MPATRPQVVGEKIEEAEQFGPVTADGQQLEPLIPVQLVQHGDYLSEVPLGQLLGFVVVSAQVGREL